MEPSTPQAPRDQTTPDFEDGGQAKRARHFDNTASYPAGLLPPAVALTALSDPALIDPAPPIEAVVGDPTIAWRWILDKARSDSMMPYQRLMGLSEMAIEAWAKAESETETYKVYSKPSSHLQSYFLLKNP